MDALMRYINRDGRDVARRFLLARDAGEELNYLRGELAGLSRATWYVTGETIDDVENRWISEVTRPDGSLRAHLEEPESLYAKRPE